jgi:hypothetical protein
MPAHQKSTVAKYLNNQEAAGTLPPKMSFNSQGRAYPDISAVAVEGTSQSSPTIAGLFSMVMDHRLNAGLPPLGFFAPRLWQTMEKHPGVAVSGRDLFWRFAECTICITYALRAWAVYWLVV